MATIQLGRHEARQGQLPPVCMRCGTAASVYRTRRFYYSPWWIYLGLPFVLLPFFVLAWYGSKPARVRVPLCPLHRNLWRWQQPVLAFVCAAGSIAFGIIPLVLAFEGKYASPRQEKILLVASLALLGGVYLY